ncbi:MAG: MBL fold metallo-hydrolase [Planctomycetota bacterium]
MKTAHVRILPVCEDYGTNGYLVRGSDMKATIIDPGTDIDTVITAVKTLGWTLKSAWITHGHFDHMGGLSELKQAVPQLEIIGPKGEEDHFRRGLKNLSTWQGKSMTAPAPDRFVSDGDTVQIGDLVFRCIRISGHSPFGICYYLAPEIAEKKIRLDAGDETVDCAGVVFTGDILFAGGIGRWDLPGGSQNALLQGIRDKLFALPDETLAFPGHGPYTTIGDEKSDFMF